MYDRMYLGRKLWELQELLINFSSLKVCLCNTTMWHNSGKLRCAISIFIQSIQNVSEKWHRYDAAGHYHHCKSSREQRWLPGGKHFTETAGRDRESENKTGSWCTYCVSLTWPSQHSIVTQKDHFTARCKFCGKNMGVNDVRDNVHSRKIEK